MTGDPEEIAHKEKCERKLVHVEKTKTRGKRAESQTAQYTGRAYVPNQRRCRHPGRAEIHRIWGNKDQSYVNCDAFEEEADIKPDESPCSQLGPDSDFCLFLGYRRPEKQ